MSSGHRPCAILPCFNNDAQIRLTVVAVRQHLADVLVVDDGSGPETQAVLDSLSEEGLARVVRRPTNSGKGAAVQHGFELALELGFTHCFQIDGDGQHDCSEIPRFLEVSRQAPEALVLGYPVYDGSAPRGRTIARGITTFWVAVEVGQRRLVRDAMIGFRVYPLCSTRSVAPRAQRMGFDIEIVVLLARAGVPIQNLPVRVRYLPVEEGGVSHFRPVRDNLGFFGLHTRLCTSGVLGWLLRRGKTSAPPESP